MSSTELGQEAYEAYCGARGWKSYTGSPLPPWARVEKHIQEGWIAAAVAVREKVRKGIRDEIRDDVWEDHGIRLND